MIVYSQMMCTSMVHKPLHQSPSALAHDPCYRPSPPPSASLLLLCSYFLGTEEVFPPGGKEGSSWNSPESYQCHKAPPWGYRSLICWVGEETLPGSCLQLRWVTNHDCWAFQGHSCPSLPCSEETHWIIMLDLSYCQCLSKVKNICAWLPSLKCNNLKRSPRYAWGRMCIWISNLSKGDCLP